MRTDLILGIFLAAGVHALAVFGHHLLPAGTAATANANGDAPPTLALAPIAQLEPEPPEQDDSTPPPDEPAAADTAAAPEPAPPAQADIPAPVIHAPFQQALQPPPPPDLGHATAIILPRTAFATHHANLKNIFDLAQLDQPPRPIFSPPPSYPYEMRRARITGTVTIGFGIDTDGAVLHPRIVRSTHPGFDAEALRTAQRWRFHPGKKAGAPVITRRVIRDIEFTLPND